MIKSKTTSLFAVPSFFRGMAATLDIGNTLSIFNDSKSVREADMKAIYSDWEAVGDDIQSALNSWETEHGKEKINL